MNLTRTTSCNVRCSQPKKVFVYRHAPLALLSLCLAAMFLACRAPQPAPAEIDYSAAPATSQEVPIPQHHWIQNDELWVIMKRLGSDTAQHWPSTLPDDPEEELDAQTRREMFLSGARLASALAESAEAIPSNVAAFGLSEADRTAFASTAELLSDQARRLGHAARRHDIEGMHRQLDAIRASCISCHTRFKDISGDLPPRT
jgi:hypothetical protein